MTAPSVYANTGGPPLTSDDVLRMAERERAKAGQPLVLEPATMILPPALHRLATAPTGEERRMRNERSAQIEHAVELLLAAKWEGLANGLSCGGAPASMAASLRVHVGAAFPPREFTAAEREALAALDALAHEDEVAEKLAALGKPRPPGDLASVQKIVSEELGYHRVSVRVFLIDTWCVVLVPEEPADAAREEQRRRRMPRVLQEAGRIAGREGARTIELLVVPEATLAYSDAALEAALRARESARAQAERPIGMGAAT